MLRQRQAATRIQIAAVIAQAAADLLKCITVIEIGYKEDECKHGKNEPNYLQFKTTVQP